MLMTVAEWVFSGMLIMMGIGMACGLVCMIKDMFFD